MHLFRKTVVQILFDTFHSQSFQQTMIQILITDYSAFISKNYDTNFIRHISFTNIQQTMIQILTTDYGAPYFDDVS